LVDVAALFTTDLLDGIDQLSREVQRRTQAMRDEIDRLANEAPPTRGRVLVVPALPGSQLGHPADGPDGAVWFELTSLRRGRLVELAASDTALAPLGVVEAVYLRMILALRRAGYDVDTHPYDWRLSMRALGEDLAQRIRREGREVDVVTHSFGGLVVRAALRAGAPGVGKVVMLGTPNHGCFDVVQGIRGNHWVLHLLAAIDGQHSALELGRRCFGTWASVYETLPERREPGDFDAFDAGVWPREGLVPDADLLSAAAENRRWLDAAVGPEAPAAGWQLPAIHLVVGYGFQTVQRAELRGDLLHYHRSDAGDGLLATDRAPLEGYPRYYARAAHIGLPNNGDVIAATLDILANGTTTQLPSEPPEPSPMALLAEDEVTEPPFQSVSGNRLGLCDLRAALSEVVGFL
jgi:hypothetical protein